MLCLLYLFLIALCGLLHKTVEQQYLLSLHEILLAYRKQNRLLLDIIRQGLEKLIEGFGSVNLSHYSGTKVIIYYIPQKMYGGRHPYFEYSD